MASKDWYWPCWIVYGLLALIAPIVALFINSNNSGLFLISLPLFLGFMIGVVLLENLPLQFTEITVNIILHAINFLTYFIIGALIGLRRDYYERKNK